MEPIEAVASYYYSTVYYIVFIFISWGTCLYYIGSAQQKILHAESSPIQGAAVLMTIIITYYLGLRPVATDFGDMYTYFNAYRLHSDEYMPINYKTEWLWENFSVFCQRMQMNPNEYFLFIEIVYIGGMFLCAWLLMRKNLWICMIFVFMALQFFSFGTNGIRNGMACSVEIVALCLVLEPGAKRIAGFIMMFLAMGIHRSTMLPSASAIATLYVIKDTKNALRFWLASIAISLVAGTAVTNFFASLGFDDRMSSYATDASEYGTAFNRTGFRWDFLLYSAFPVAMIWYVTRFRRFTDMAYTLFANVYLLCNAFWIMVIRSSFSNRFAYLSWFIYPIVMAMPLLRMNLWKDQDRRTAIILFFYCGFTFFMFFIYYFGSTGFKGFDQYWWRRG